MVSPASGRKVLEFVCIQVFSMTTSYNHNVRSHPSNSAATMVFGACREEWSTPAKASPQPSSGISFPSRLLPVQHPLCNCYWPKIDQICSSSYQGVYGGGLGFHRNGFNKGEPQKLRADRSFIYQSGDAHFKSVFPLI